MERKLQPSNGQKEAEPAANLPGLNPVEAGTANPARPFQAYVETEARKFWQDMVQVGSLAKPDVEEIRSGAMPWLARDMRNSYGSRRHEAVAVMVQHLREDGWIKQPVYEAMESSSYIDALIQLADNARWSAYEFPLENVERCHPPVYYTPDITGLLRPRADCLLHQHRPGFVAKQLAEPVRPYQTHAEREARQFWQDLVQAGSLAKPDVEEIRSGAMPWLVRDMRNRYGSRRHKAVAAVVQHLREEGWIRRPVYDAMEGCSYIDALIQLADDADWLAREIPLPDHPAPKHPCIYYTVDPETKLPVPRDDARIIGNYVTDSRGVPVTRAAFIYPWPGTEKWMPTVRGLLLRKNWDACYRLQINPVGKELQVLFSWIVPESHAYQSGLVFPVVNTSTDIRFYPFQRPVKWYPKTGRVTD